MQGEMGLRGRVRVKILVREPQGKRPLQSIDIEGGLTLK
jgi:hypothetical protein